MAQSYETDSGTLFIPGAYPTIKVQAAASGLAATGVVMLVGEADAGPDWSLETDLSLNSYGPDQAGDVVSKYKSGALVDAFKLVTAAANDPQIQGAPSRIILAKTNVSTKASGALPKIGGGTYGTLYDKSFGKLGNLIYFTVASKTAEVKPTTSPFTYVPPVGTVQIGLRTNGNAEVQRTGVAAETPTVFVAAVNGLTGISATGGVNRTVLTSAHGSIAAAAPGGAVITITLSVIANWDVTPTVGDTLVIPAGSAIAGAGNANVGGYVITAATATIITATKLSDAAKPGAVIGVVTNPVAVSVTAVIGANADLIGYSPVTITQSASTVVDGLGKSLEINENTGGTDLLSRTAYVLGTTTAVTWVSKTSAPQLLTSASEYSVNLNVNRQLDGVQETWSAGGRIGIKVGYAGTDATVVVTPTTITLTPTGGAGSVLSLAFKDYPTLADLVAYINSQTGYKAAVGSTVVGQMASTALDEGTFHASSTYGNYTMRLKLDAVDFATAVNSGSGVVQLGNPALPVAAGIPDVTPSTVWLAGGVKGGTTDALYNAAVDALEAVQGNFLVPLFSRDAAADITDGLTESTSTYTAANVQAYARTHVTKLSTMKRRRHRQAIVASRGTFQAAKDAAATMASALVAMTFQDVKAVGANGIVQFQPHMLSTLAAGMQAAGFYRALVKKGINCTGILQAAGDFKDGNDTNVEDALQSGLLIAKKDSTGGISWVSDQTTYGKDNNFVYNSFQAVYVSFIIALTCSQRMETAFVGQSVADVSAALALAALEGIMADFLRLKLIAASDDAPKGFKNAVVRISGDAMVVSIEVKLAGAIYFIPINFQITQVTQTASS